MRNITAYIAGWLLAAILLIPQAHAAFTATPNLSGYARNAATGGYLRNTPGQVQYLLDAQLRYSGSGLVRVGGHTITVPAKIPLSATAATVAKAAMRATPWLLVGTAALSWLDDQGIFFDPITETYVKNDPTAGTYPGGLTWYAPGSPGQRYYATAPGSYSLVPYGACMGASSTCSVEAAAIDYAKSFFGSASPGSHITDKSGTWTSSGCYEITATRYRCTISVGKLNGTTATGYTADVYRTTNAAPSTTPTIPVTQTDWDNLPDPIPAIGNELPSAPYLPDGAPVDSPIYESGRYPLGDPYKAPDGTTRQDYAHVTNNYNIDNSVTITTSTTTITDAQGNPVTQPETETDTQPDQCEKYPESVGCQELGTDSFDVPRNTVQFTFTPEADILSGGSCPAPISVLGHSISYQPACDAMTMIRPVVLGMASVIAAYILFGAFRGVD